MDFSVLGIASVAAITIICYGFGLVAKLVPWYTDKLIPPLCAIMGAVLGGIAFLAHMPDFPATDLITSIAVGIVSGLASTGMNQVYKQLSNSKKE